MSFNVFTDRIARLLQQKMGEDFTVTLTKVLKNNDVSLTGVVIMEEAESISPTIYLEEPYRQYQDGTSLKEIVDEIAALYEKHAHHVNLDMDFFRNYASVAERIYHKVVNYEKNRKLLDDVPYFRWHDLAVIFYYAMEESAFGRASILIHNNHLDMWGQPAEEVYRIACRNMRRNMPELLMPMHRLLEDTMGIRLEESESSMPLYVLTNRERLFGASAMLYSEKIKELAGKLNMDLLILPSSVHEVLLLPDDKVQDYDFYREMVREVNTTQVDPEEILSFSLYRYDREKAEIEKIGNDLSWTGGVTARGRS